MEFFAGVLAPAEEQVRVRVCVIADRVTLRGNFFRERRALADEFADEKKCGFGVVFASSSSSFGVIAGLGPSSNVSASLFAAGVCQTAGPKSCARGNPAP